ncbi:hypothetical protein IWX49DRAFT_549563 [Phyllosticta citricarpa]|uniref:DUF1772-domain-containing protein n=2 Tax=Phyllosticta TaxID=121621 RepID=A0ABR1MN63_9PEZI
MSLLTQDWNSSPIVRTAQVVGITSAFMIAGGSGYISYGALPAYRVLPAPLKVQQWQLNFEAGKAAAPWFGLAGGISFSYLIWHQSQVSGPSRALYLYTLAGVLLPGIVPYTKVVMKNVNSRLAAKAKQLSTAQQGDDAWTEKGVPEDDTVDALVNQWRWLNAVRAVAGFVGGVSGLIALVWRD